MPVPHHNMRHYLVDRMMCVRLNPRQVSPRFAMIHVRSGGEFCCSNRVCANEWMSAWNWWTVDLLKQKVLRWRQRCNKCGAESVGIVKPLKRSAPDQSNETDTAGNLGVFSGGQVQSQSHQFFQPTVASANLFMDELDMLDHAIYKYLELIDPQRQRPQTMLRPSGGGGTGSGSGSSGPSDPQAKSEQKPKRNLPHPPALCEKCSIGPIRCWLTQPSITLGERRGPGPMTAGGTTNNGVPPF